MGAAVNHVNLALVLSLLVAISAVTFTYKLYHARSTMRRLARDGMPMPPHHWLLGHILIAGKIFMELPPRAHLLPIADQIRRRHPHLDTAFYLDTWPFGPPALIVLSPVLAAQFTQEKSLPKFGGTRKFLEPLTGKKDLVTLEGHEWRYWRRVLNPGFSAANITNFIPIIIRDVCTYRHILRRRARVGDIFPLELVTLSMSMDIIGRVVMDHELGCQFRPNQFTTALINQLAWCDAGIHSNPLQYFNFIRPLMLRYNTWRMNTYIDPYIKKNYLTIDQGLSKRQQADLMGRAYLRDNKPSASMSEKVDPQFFEFMRAQIKLFMQAGHDTTAASIVYSLYLLQKHPKSLSRLRRELDQVFGPLVNATCDQLSDTPQLLGQCNFLNAVVKETLRLFPPTASARFGETDMFLHDTNGTAMPTKGFLLVSNHHGIHHNPRFWPQAEDFLPERWLAEPDDPLYPVQNGWRPFERGPRNCIGQELAMTEIKLVIAVIAREFDIHDAYAEVDAKKRNRGRGLCVNGERAYPIFRGGGHPSENFPCRVPLR